VGGTTTPSPETTRQPDVVGFDVYDLRLSTRELLKHGLRIKLPPQAFRVLQMLVERPGQLITREEFHRALWPADTFVDFDQGLNSAVKKIRDVLNDSAETPRYIETLPRLGYRFIGQTSEPANVTVVERKTAPAETKDSGEFLGQEGKSLLQESSTEIPTMRRALIAIGAAALILLSGFGAWRYHQNGGEPPIEILPLTGSSGYEGTPSFSPDGNQVAFVLRGPEDSGIYTALVGGEKLLRLTSGQGDRYPRWSPDGRQIAFSRPSQEGLAIF
jgi:DNA-binding winged helix-turn-helix (wHTH) protein